MEKISEQVASALLEIKAVKLSPEKPFTWASGWHSPIYCDNRKTLSYPEVRHLLRDAFVEIIRREYPEVEVIAGVATGAIAIGVLVADAMNLPFVYVRSAPKTHGLENVVEGVLNAGAKVVVVEDLVSTGGSSLQAVDALRAAGAIVLGMTAIFTYEFPKSVERFAASECKLITLSGYSALLELALKSGYISSDQTATLAAWREAPEVWGV